MTIENENTITVTDENATIAVKSAEQIASENNLQFEIKDDLPVNAENQTGAVDQKPKINPETAIKEVLTVVPMGLHMAGLNNAAAVWSDDACGAISSALVPVLRKYAFGQRMLAYLESGGGMAEGVLIMALWPVASATYDGYLLDMQKKNKDTSEKLNEKLFEGYQGEVGQAGKIYQADTEKGSTYKYEESKPL